MRYLGIELRHPKIAVFDFTSCEGCALQLANKEDTLTDFLRAINVVDFREISSERRDDYEIAFVEGSVSRPDEIGRLQAIRERTRILVAMGSCACFGGVNKLKNSLDAEAANREVYGDDTRDTMAVRPLREFVQVDLEIPGCPVSKPEIEHVVQRLILDIPVELPAYPVCVECKQRFLVCMFNRGEMCLGPITRAGCNAPCPAGGLGCWGCRGPVTAANFLEFLSVVKERGFSNEIITERLSFFGAFEEALRLL